MDSSLPQMETFDFDRLDPIALEQTLAYLKAHPEPEDFQALMDDAVAEKDWLGGDGMQDTGMEMGMGGQSRMLEHTDHLGPPRGSFFTGAQLDKAFHPQEDIFTKSASGRCGLQTPRSSICMASELLLDVSYSQSSGGVGSPLTQTAFDSRQVSPRNLATGPTKTTSRISAGCTWDGCQLSLPSSNDLTNHLIEHSKEALAGWVPHSRCVWQGCKSKAIFKTTVSYGNHLRNIHSHPLVCNVPKCTHRRPFRNDADLDRHDLTAHLKEQKYECPYETCDAETRAFARKDKWIQHIRETQHQNDAFCPFFHCSLQQQKTLNAFADRKEISKHFTLCHFVENGAGYECALGSCDGDRIHDFWTLHQLCSHVFADHGFPLDSFLVEVILKERVLIIQHLRYYALRHQMSLTTYHDCTICAPQSQSAAHTHY